MEDSLEPHTFITMEVSEVLQQLVPVAHQYLDNGPSLIGIGNKHLHNRTVIFFSLLDLKPGSHRCRADVSQAESRMIAGQQCPDTSLPTSLVGSREALKSVLRQAASPPSVRAAVPFSKGLAAN